MVCLLIFLSTGGSNKSKQMSGFYNGETAALALVIEYDGTPIGDVALWLTDKDHRQGEIGWV